MFDLSRRNQAGNFFSTSKARVVTAGLKPCLATGTRLGLKKTLSRRDEAKREGRSVGCPLTTPGSLRGQAALRCFPFGLHLMRLIKPKML